MTTSPRAARRTKASARVGPTSWRASSRFSRPASRWCTPSMSCTLTVDIFLSVDGWAGSDGLPAYFGYFGPELEEWIRTELAAPQVVIMGRRTYEALAGLPDAARDESWRRMSELDKVVFSRTLRQADWPNTRVCDADVVDEIRRLKGDGDTPLRTMGSLSLARQLTDAGLVDRLRLMTFPLIAGDAGR